MSTLEPLNSMELANGLKISIFNHTKVYFGDYHHVRIKIVCSPGEISPEIPASAKAASYTRTLEKMGVPSREVESVIVSLLQDFESNSLPYLSTPDFPKRMIENFLSKKESVARTFLGASS